AYQLSGAVYAFWRDNLRNPTHEVLCGEIRAVIIPAARSFDIDGPLDLRAAEAVLAAQQASPGAGP
ncbi:MAG: hypothetical protein V1774_10370, partial [Candidatus Eisenbacteria bacterium]